MRGYKSTIALQSILQPRNNGRQQAESLPAEAMSLQPVTYCASFQKNQGRPLSPWAAACKARRPDAGEENEEAVEQTTALRTQSAKVQGLRCWSPDLYN